MAVYVRLLKVSIDIYQESLLSYQSATLSVTGYTLAEFVTLLHMCSVQLIDQSPPLVTIADLSMLNGKITALL